VADGDPREYPVEAHDLLAELWESVHNQFEQERMMERRRTPSAAGQITHSCSSNRGSSSIASLKFNALATHNPRFGTTSTSTYEVAFLKSDKEANAITRSKWATQQSGSVPDTYAANYPRSHLIDASFEFMIDRRSDGANA
jgi:hypothetical protein